MENSLITYREKGTDNEVQFPLEKVKRQDKVRYTIKMDGKVYLKS